MALLVWDQTGARTFETGVDRGCLYIPDATGAYPNGVAWNGLVTVTESRTGAEANPQYADNMKYLNLLSAEEFGATIEAFTYPDEFLPFDGMATPSAGVRVGQQSRKYFGFCFRTRIGNDVDGTDAGYQLHLVYGALATPTEKAYGTINDSPEAITFSWDLTTTPVAFTSGNLKPTAQITIDSTDVVPAKLAILEGILYGSAGAPRLPLPDEVVSIFANAQTSATPAVPVYTSATHTIAIPTTTGVDYFIDGVKKTGNVVLTVGQQVIVVAKPQTAYYFPNNTDNDWQYTY